MNRLALIPVIAAVSFTIAAPAFAGGNHHEEADGCDHGATSKTCRPDPRPTNGKDCEKHGNHGGINEDHCGPASTPKPTTTGGTPSPSSTTTPSGTTTNPSPSPTSSTPTTTVSSSPTSSASSSTAHPTTSSTDSPPSATPSTANATQPTSPLRSVPSSTDAPPELARTGTNLSDLAAVALFILALGAILGWFAWALGRNRGEH